MDQEGKGKFPLLGVSINKRVGALEESISAIWIGEPCSYPGGRRFATLFEQVWAYEIDLQHRVRYRTLPDYVCIVFFHAHQTKYGALKPLTHD